MCAWFMCMPMYVVSGADPARLMKGGGGVVQDKKGTIT